MLIIVRYNGVILNVHFPLVVYKKLLMGKPNLNDLKELHPVIHFIHYFSFFIIINFTIRCLEEVYKKCWISKVM